MSVDQQSAATATGVGIIGAGVISGQYLQNLTAFPNLDVRFIADLDEARADTRAREFGIPASGSVEELLARDDIEIVVNLTVPAVHVDVGLKIIAAGKHVWSEKPIALDRRSGQTLLEAAWEAGVRVACAPDTFLGPGIQRSRRMIESGEIGTPLTALTLMQSPGPESWHPNPDFLFQAGGGPLFDIGPYYLTTLVQIFGPITRVTATSSSSRTARTIGSGPRAGEEFAVTVPTHIGALYEFADGRSAQSIFSFDSKLGRTRFEVSGADGTLVVPDPNTFDGDVVVFQAPDQEVTFPGAAEKSTRGTGVAEFAQAIREGRAERASGQQAYHVLDAMVSTIESADQGRPIAVESTVEIAPPLPQGWEPRRLGVIS